MSEKPVHPNGTIEAATIPVSLMRTLDGKPTCALHFASSSTVCPFLRMKPSGMSGGCAIAHGGIYADNENGTGFLRPARDCPIHHPSSLQPKLTIQKEPNQTPP